MYWSTRYGLNVLASGTLPRTDTYSWTASGRPWIPNSWGWNVVLGLFYRSFGMAGFAVLVVLLTAAAGVAVALAARRLGAAPIHSAIVFAAFAPILVMPYARAETLSCLLVLAVPWLTRRLMTAPRGSAVRCLAVMAAAEVVWANLHSAALVGPVLVGAGGLGVLLRQARTGAQWRAGLARLIPAVAVTFAACLATPYGISTATHLPEVRRASAGMISEWNHPGFGSLGQQVGLLAIVMATGAGRLAWRAGHPAITGVLVVLGVGTIGAIRFTPMVAVVAMPVLAAALSRADVRPHMARRILAVGCAVAVLVVGYGLGHYSRTERLASSPSLVRLLPSGCRVVNDYEIGASIVLHRTDDLVSVDGRNDMYGRAKVLDALGLLANRPGTSARMAAAGVDCVLAQSRWPLVRELAADPGWRVVGSDGVRTLLVRRATP